jgi:hypothetical protein
VWSGNSLPQFRDNLSVKGQEIEEEMKFLVLEDGADRLTRKVGNELPLYAV